MNSKNNKPPIIIISGPSGAGEDAVIDGLKSRLKFNRVITTVTREPRAGESQGDPYYFIDAESFLRLIQNDKLIEWAIVYGDYRGCTKQEIKRLLELTDPIIWKVDWQGVKTIKERVPEAVSIFISPPSFEILEQRLKKRGRDSAREIKNREEFSKEWFKHQDVYDYVVINEEGKLPETVKQVEQIIRSKLAA